jgi:hypothetical protein
MFIEHSVLHNAARNQMTRFVLMVMPRIVTGRLTQPTKKDSLGLSTVGRSNQNIFGSFADSFRAGVWLPTCLFREPVEEPLLVNCERLSPFPKVFRLVFDFLV